MRDICSYPGSRDYNYNHSQTLDASYFPSILEELRSSEVITMNGSFLNLSSDTGNQRWYRLKRQRAEGFSTIMQSQDVFFGATLSKDEAIDNLTGNDEGLTDFTRSPVQKRFRLDDYTFSFPIPQMTTVSPDASTKPEVEWWKKPRNTMDCRSQDSWMGPGQSFSQKKVASDKKLNFCCFVCETTFTPTSSAVNGTDQLESSHKTQGVEIQLKKQNSLLRYFAPVSTPDESLRNASRMYKNEGKIKIRPGVDGVKVPWNETASIVPRLPKVPGCSFHERPTCPDCIGTCEQCHLPYCRMCLTIDCYFAYTRTVCKDCAQQRDEAQRELQNVDAMECS